jgi:predicted nucleic acid-binding Zn ribbon protein
MKNLVQNEVFESPIETCCEILSREKERVRSLEK